MRRWALLKLGQGCLLVSLSRVIVNTVLLAAKQRTIEVTEMRTIFMSIKDRKDILSYQH
jgi:hypothetical protein